MKIDFNLFNMVKKWKQHYDKSKINYAISFYGILYKLLRIIIMQTLCYNVK